MHIIWGCQCSDYFELILWYRLCGQIIYVQSFLCFFFAFAFGSLFFVHPFIQIFHLFWSIFALATFFFKSKHHASKALLNWFELKDWETDRELVSQYGGGTVAGVVLKPAVRLFGTESPLAAPARFTAESSAKCLLLFWIYTITII